MPGSVAKAQHLTKLALGVDVTNCMWSAPSPTQRQQSRIAPPLFTQRQIFEQICWVWPLLVAQFAIRQSPASQGLVGAVTPVPPEFQQSVSESLALAARV